VALGGRWLHDFQNNLRDRFFFTWKIDVTLWRYWNVQAGGNSVMEQLYRYKQDVDPWQDISDSMRVWDGERRNASLFRLKNFYVQLSHDLHCWEMIVGWQVSQQLQPFGVHLNHRLSYYDHRVYFAFHSKQQRSVGIQPTEIYRHQVDSEDYN
jgi:hypothetical protein